MKLSIPLALAALLLAPVAAAEQKSMHETLPQLAPDRWDRDRKQMKLPLVYDDQGRPRYEDRRRGQPDDDRHKSSRR